MPTVCLISSIDQWCVLLVKNTADNYVFMVLTLCNRAYSWTCASEFQGWLAELNAIKQNKKEEW